MLFKRGRLSFLFFAVRSNPQNAGWLSEWNILPLCNKLASKRLVRISVPKRSRVHCNGHSCWRWLTAFPVTHPGEDLIQGFRLDASLEQSMDWGWRDGFMGKNTCSENLKAWVQIPSTQVKMQLWLHACNCSNKETQADPKSSAVQSENLSQGSEVESDRRHLGWRDDSELGCSYRRLSHMVADIHFQRI